MNPAGPTITHPGYPYSKRHKIKEDVTVFPDSSLISVRRLYARASESAPTLIVTAFVSDVGGLDMAGNSPTTTNGIACEQNGRTSVQDLGAEAVLLQTRAVHLKSSKVSRRLHACASVFEFVTYFSNV